MADGAGHRMPNSGVRFDVVTVVVQETDLCCIISRERSDGHRQRALSVGLIGLKAFIVQIQAFVSPGLPYFSTSACSDTSLSEARERVKSACQASGFKWPETRVTVNLSPASMPKKGSSHDLAIAASVLQRGRRNRP